MDSKNMCACNHLQLSDFQHVQVIGEFHIRKLETRGDSCFCVSGTNSVTSDLCATQVTLSAPPSSTSMLKVLDLGPSNQHQNNQQPIIKRKYLGRSRA
jgi:hypothetical protein